MSVLKGHIGHTGLCCGKNHYFDEWVKYKGEKKMSPVVLQKTAGKFAFQYKVIAA